MSEKLDQMMTIAWIITIPIVILGFVLGRFILGVIIGATLVAGIAFWLLASAQVYVAQINADAIIEAAKIVAGIEEEEPDPPVETTGNGPIVRTPATRTGPTGPPATRTTS